MTERPIKIAKADGIAVVRPAGFPEETIQALESELDDPIDIERDAVILLRRGVTIDRLIDRMGGSP